MSAITPEEILKTTNLIDDKLGEIKVSQLMQNALAEEITTMRCFLNGEPIEFRPRQVPNSRWQYVRFPEWAFDDNEYRVKKLKEIWVGFLRGSTEYLSAATRDDLIKAAKNGMHDFDRVVKMREVLI